MATLTLVSGDNDENKFDWMKVGISVLARFLKQTAFKSINWDYISFVVPLTSCQCNISD